MSFSLHTHLHMHMYTHSWHLWAVLSALDYTHMHPTRQAQLHTSFATQLESSGLWEWAVFVLLHLEDPVLCRYVCVCVRVCVHACVCVCVCVHWSQKDRCHA